MMSKYEKILPGVVERFFCTIEKGQEADVSQNSELVAANTIKAQAWANKTNAEASEIRGRNYISWALVITGFTLSLTAIPWPHMTNIVSITGSVSIIGGVINLTFGGNILQKFKRSKE